jgi:hypothetical protein
MSLGGVQIYLFPMKKYVHTYTKKIFDFTEIYPVGKMQPLSRSVKNHHSQLLQLRPSNQETLVIESIPYSYSL